MIVIKLIGGLGNQMFEYAAARNLALKNKSEVFVDLTYLLDRTPRKDMVFRDFDLPIFNVKYSTATPDLINDFLGNKKDLGSMINKVKNKLAGKSFTYYHEPHFHFNPEVPGLKGNIYLEGYFQSQKYFIENEDVIRNDFTFREKFNDHITRLAEKILSSENSLCINVRRGDFVSNASSNATHGVLDNSYYHTAIKVLSEKKNKPFKIFVFSDEIDWCRTNLKFDHETVFVDHDYAGHKFSSYLYLMTMCRNFIIPNSSFGWWAAWLSKHKEKEVIAPVKWFSDERRDASDIYPESWIRI